MRESRSRMTTSDTSRAVASSAVIDAFATLEVLPWSTALTAEPGSRGSDQRPVFLVTSGDDR